jgi:uncharacterized protein YdhG (YjbR/CyaY superfamily)
MAATPKTVDEYLAAAPPDKRAVLQRLRKTIKAAAPKATESISYGLVGFKYKGRPLAYFAYWKLHCSLYGLSSQVIEQFAPELAPYKMSKVKGTIQFAPAEPLPDRLVARMVKAHVAEIDRESAH